MNTQKIIVIAFWMLSFCVMAQPKKEYYDNEQTKLKSETNIVKGMPHGRYIEYYKNGNVSRNHLTWSMDWKGERVGIVEMRRHYTNYFKGVSNFKEHRLKLVTLESADALFKALDEIQEVYVDYQFV